MPNFPFAKKEADDSTGFLLWQLTALWQRAVANALKPYNLTQVQFVLLASLLWLENKHQNITQIMLARYAKLDVMMTSTVLRSLEKRGLLCRQQHPSDTRAKILTLTKEGKKLAITAVPVVEAIDKRFFAANEEDIKHFNKELKAMISQQIVL